MMTNNTVTVTGTGIGQQQQQAQIQHSNDVDEELQRVIIALTTVFGGGTRSSTGTTTTITTTTSNGDPTTIYNLLQYNRQYADQYLISFQKQPISWMVCDQLLSKLPSQQENNNNSNSIIEQQWWFFASQTIHVKCCTNIYDLPYNTLPSLRDSLLQHLYRFCSIQSQNQQNQNKNQSLDALVHRLAMCISALAVQMGWITIIQDILSYDTTATTTTTTISNTVESTVFVQPVLMLLLKTLPEECASDKLLLLDDTTRYQIRDQLISSASIVFTYLVSQLQNNSTNTTNELILKVFLVWVRYVPIRPNTLIETPLLLNSIRALNIPIDSNTNTLNIQQSILSIKFLELAADVVIELLHMYPSHHYNNEQLVRTMIPELSQLPFDSILGMLTVVVPGSVQRDTNTMITDIQQIYSRIVIEMGESYITLLLSATEYKQYTKIINYILYCSQCNNSDISSMTFHFWYTFVNDIDNIQPYEYRQELIDYYTQYLLLLINICCTNLMKYPIDIIDDDDDNYDPNDVDDRMDDIINHRLYVSETIEDCCRLLGGHIVLTEIGNYLKKEVQRVSSSNNNNTNTNKNEQWIGIESGIACIIALHKFVTSDDNDIIPYCCTLIPQLSSSLSSRRLLQSTCCIFIGKYSFWISAAAAAANNAQDTTNMIPSLLSYLSNSLQIPTCTTHAATSMMELCKKSNTIFQLSDPVLNLYESYIVNNNNNNNNNNTNQQRQLPIADEILLLQGVCLALSRTIQDNYNTIDSSRQYLLRLAQPIIHRLGVSIQQQQQQQINDNTFLQNTILPDIDRLTTIIMHLVIVYDPNQGTIHPIIELLQSIWNIIETIIQQYPKSTDVAEKICRLHKYSIRSCGIHAYRSMVEPLVQHIIQCFTITQQSPYLYLASICISEYKDDINSTTTGTAERFLYMISSMANTVFTFIQSFLDITNNPDIVEEMFYLMGRMIDYFPTVFITNPIIQPICDCSMIAIQIEHQGGQKGTLKFLDSLLSYGIKLRSSSSSSTVTGTIINNNDVTVAYEMILGHIGPAITVQLVRILIGDLPSYGNQASDIIYKMNQLCTKQLSIWLMNGMTSTSNGNGGSGPTTTGNNNNNNNNTNFVNCIPEHARNEFISAIDLQLSNDDFNLIVSAFQQACDRERRRIRRS